MGDEKGHGLDPQPGAPARLSAPVWRVGAGASRGVAERRPGWGHRVLLRLVHVWFRLVRGMTLGVRVMAFDPQGRIFLVRHTYVPGWHLPGGGIEVGQNADQAARMELAEEGNIVPVEGLRLFGVYFNTSASRRDHVLLFLAYNVAQSAPRLPDREIAEARFFALDALPEDVTQGTLRRLDEVLGEKPGDRYW